MTEDFWERVEQYKKMGLDPLRWVAGCAVKVDLTTVVYPALKMIKPKLESLGVTISPREDADIFPYYGDVDLERKIYDVNNPKVDTLELKRINPRRAISLIQVHQKNAKDAKSFANALLSIYENMRNANIRFTVGKGHSIITAYQDSEFILFDFLKYNGEKQEGLCLANNDTIQVIDPTLDPGSEVQAQVAACNTMNDLITLGCFENIRMYPVIDAPTDKLYKEISSNMEKLADKNGIAFSEMEPVGKGKLLIGATVTGSMYKEPPTFYDKIEKGMKILVTRPFGDLAPINVYLSCLADESYVEALEKEGITLEDVRKAKENVLATMAKPNIEVGRIINKYCPEYGGSFNPDENIAATGDLSGPGIYIFKEIAESAKVDMRLDVVPLYHEELVQFATKNFLMDNGTAGTNGAIGIIASSDLIDNIKKDLSSQGYNPRIIGEIIEKGDGRLFVPEKVRNYISSRNLLKEFTLL